jgi:hypothetical protein
MYLGFREFIYLLFIIYDGEKLTFVEIIILVLHERNRIRQTDRRTDRRTNTLALRGLEETFFRLRCCVVSVFGSGGKCGTLFSGGLFWDRAGNSFWCNVRT